MTSGTWGSAEVGRFAEGRVFDKEGQPLTGLLGFAGARIRQKAECSLDRAEMTSREPRELSGVYAGLKGDEAKELVAKPRCASRSRTDKRVMDLEMHLALLAHDVAVRSQLGTGAVQERTHDTIVSFGNKGETVDGAKEDLEGLGNAWCLRQRGDGFGDPLAFSESDTRRRSG